MNRTWWSVCFLCALSFASAEEPQVPSLLQDVAHYNLVKDQPDVYVSKKAEQLGGSFAGGSVWGKDTIKAFYAALEEKKGSPFVVVDIGAYTGSFTLLAKFFPLSTWYAFEPYEESADALQQSLDLNEIANVAVYKTAVSHSTGRDLLKVPKGQWHAGLSTLGEKPHRFSSYDAREVDTITLDEFVEKNGLEKVDFIKVHTQGWEANVLAGAAATIKRDRPVLLLEFNETNFKQCGQKGRAVIDFLLKNRYRWQFVSSEDVLCFPYDVKRNP